jgi:hypothetical protein
MRARDWFSGHADILVFRGFYSTNADKITAAVLGIVASWVLWFGAIEELRFRDAVFGDPAHEAFLAGVFAGTLSTLLMSLLAFLMFRVQSGLRVLGLGPVLAAIYFFVAASLNHFPFAWEIGSLWRSGVYQWGNAAIGSVLLVATAEPLFLVLIGDWLNHRLDRQADACRVLIAESNLSNVQSASVTPPAGHDP